MMEQVIWNVMSFFMFSRAVVMLQYQYYAYLLNSFNSIIFLIQYYEILNFSQNLLYTK